MIKPRTVLIVDDEHLIRLNLGIVLEDLGYRVMEAANGREALLALEQELPDLVLTDLRMPEMDGLELVYHLTARYPEIPLVVISGIGTIRDAMEAVRNGAWDYLVKPVDDQDALEIIIQRVMERALLMGENRRHREHLEELVHARTIELETANSMLQEEIAERKLAEEALRVREREFRTLAENSPDSILRYDIACRCIYANPHIEKTLGIPTGGMTGKTPMELFPAGEYREYQNRIAEVVRSGAGAEIELVVPDSGEGVQYHHIRFTAERNADGSVAGVLVIGRDMTERRQAEEQIRLLNYALDHMREGAFLVELNEGKFLQVNQEACRSLEYSREELTGMSALDIDPNFSPELLKDNIAELLRQGSMTFESCHRTKSGNIFPVELNASIFEYNATRYSLCLVRNITERKRAEEMTQARFRIQEMANRPGISMEEMLRRMLDEIETQTGSSIGFYHFLEEDQQTFSLQAWSSNTLTTTCTAEGMGRHYPVADAGVWADCVRERRPVIHNDYASLPNRKGMPDGHAAVVRELAVPIFRGPRIVAVIGMGNKRDEYNQSDMLITSLLGDFSWEIVTRKLAEENLQESEKRLRMTLEATQIGIFDWDVQNDRWTASPVYYTMLGYKPENSPGNRLDWLERVHPDDREYVATKIHEALAGSPGDYQYEARMLHADGTFRWQFVKGFGIERDPAGKVTRMLGVRLDITERKRAEEDLRCLNEELEDRVTERTAELEQANTRLLELDRMKSMFIASMSHELRTPLNSVIGFSRILCNEWIGTVNREQKESLETILRSGKHLLSLVNDVIDVSKIEAGLIEAVPGQVDIYDIVSEAVTSCKNVARDKGIALAVQAIHHTMQTDRTRLLQCLLNLVSNAVKYTEQGTVTISAKLASEGGMLELSVADTGIGIAEEDRCKLFTPFVRLDSPLKMTVPGTGLGLYLTRKLATEVLQGDVTVASTPGAGSVFVLRVPTSVSGCWP